MDLKFLGTVGKGANLEKCTSLYGLAGQQTWATPNFPGNWNPGETAIYHNPSLKDYATLNSNPVFSEWT